MECIDRCDKSQCSKDIVCPRVQAMARFIADAREKLPYTTTLPEVVAVGKITPEQWRDGYRDQTIPCFKRTVEEMLGGEIVYESSRVLGVSAVGVRRLTFFSARVP